MNATDARYTQFALCREMMDTVRVIDRFDPSLTESGANKIFCYPNIYQVQQGASEPTVIGLGEGAAVPFNTKLSVLSAEVREIYAEQKASRDDR